MPRPYPTILIDVARLSAWLILLSAIFVPLEYLFAVRPHRLFRRQFFTDLGYYFLNNLLPAVLLSLPISVLAAVAHRCVPAPLRQAVAGLPFVARAALGFVVGEVGYYWAHRWSHEIPLLWRFHAVHHSAEEMDFLVNTRAHPLDAAFGRFAMLLPVYLLGLAGPGLTGGTSVPVAVVLIGTMWSFFIHANLRWRFGPLEWVLSTPAFHHWHHTKTGPINRNYASNIPAIDWIFGSLYLPREWPSDYGIKAEMPGTLVDQLVHPFFPAQDAPPRSQSEPESVAPEEAPLADAAPGVPVA